MHLEGVIMASISDKMVDRMLFSVRGTMSFRNHVAKEEGENRVHAGGARQTKQNKGKKPE